ncbi:MAG TPA: FecR domain-containing protein, partial [Blastocatellia bacterium]|nr:FecR domain-containing protein [Blastocatellia bacterium]
MRVKKANGTDFVTADEKMPLDAGDTIQTLSNSVARVQFIDGSSYTIKPDTTLVIKDNELMDDRSTKVQVKVRVGTINLATNEQGPGSSNVVQTEVAEAKIGENTEASVGAGDSGQQADIRVTRGDAQIRTHSGETYQARTNERLEFEANGKLARRTSLVGMPTLKLPENQQTIRLENTGTIRFEWQPVAQASSYAMEIATSST